MMSVDARTSMCDMVPGATPAPEMTLGAVRLRWHPGPNPFVQYALVDRAGVLVGNFLAAP
jgi:hypothetical protein